MTTATKRLNHSGLVAETVQYWIAEGLRACPQAGSWCRSTTTGAIRAWSPDEWNRHELVLPAMLLAAGANELTFRWPSAARGRQSMSAAMAMLSFAPESLHLIRIARMRLTARIA